MYNIYSVYYMQYKVIQYILAGVYGVVHGKEWTRRQARSK